MDCEPETVSQDESLCILFLSRICLQRCKSYKVGVPWSPGGRCAEWSTMSSASEQQKLLVFLALTVVIAGVSTEHSGVAGYLWVFWTTEQPKVATLSVIFSVNCQFDRT